MKILVSIIFVLIIVIGILGAEIARQVSITQDLVKENKTSAVARSTDAAVDRATYTSGLDSQLDIQSTQITNLEEILATPEPIN